MRRSRVFHVLIALAAAFLLWHPAQAQKITGTITGTVTDTSSAAVPGATVTVTNTATNKVHTVTTDSQGGYTVAELPESTYQINVKAANFKEFVTKGAVVHVATTTTVDAQLQLGSVSESVTVQANAIQVQTDSAALGAVVDGRQVKELPLNGRNFVELTQLQPGVSAANNFVNTGKGLNGGVDMSVNGNPTTNNLFLVDGVNNNDVGSNRTILIYPSNESIAEFKMLLNSYGPEYGQASGRHNQHRHPQRQQRLPRQRFLQRTQRRARLLHLLLRSECRQGSSSRSARTSSAAMTGATLSAVQSSRTSSSSSGARNGTTRSRAVR